MGPLAPAVDARLDAIDARISDLDDRYSDLASALDDEDSESPEYERLSERIGNVEYELDQLYQQRKAIIQWAEAGLLVAEGL